MRYLLALLLSCLTVATAGTIDGRWQSYYAQGDSIRRQGSVTVTTQAADTKAGAYLQSGFLSWDLRNTTLVFKVRASSWFDVKVASLLISNGSDFKASATLDLKRRLANPPPDEWITVSVPPSAWANKDAVDWSKVDTILIQAMDLGYQRLTLEIKDITTVPTPPAPAIVSITVDDGLPSTMLIAKMMRDHNMAGTAFVDHTTIDTPGYLTTAQLDTLRSWGWVIGGHRIGRMSQLQGPALPEFVSASARFMIKHRQRDPLEFAWSNGLTNSTIAAAMVGRYPVQYNINGMSNSQAGIVPTSVNRHSLDRHTTLTMVQTWVDEASKQGEWVVLNFHTLARPTVTDEDWDTGDFEELLLFLHDAQNRGVRIATTAEILDILPKIQ